MDCKGQKDSTRQVVLGFEEDEDDDERGNNNNEEEEEEVNPDDEVQIVIKPAKSYLNDTEDNDEEEEQEENDILTELNVRRKEQQLRGRSRVNGTDKVDATAVASGSGNADNSGSEGSQDSSLNTSLLSKRRKLGLSRMTPTSKNNGSGASTSAATAAASSSINFSAHLQSAKSLFSDKNILASSSLNASTTSLNSLAPKRSFNAGLYGSMSALSDSRLLNIKSPYYNGPTMFGGASAYSQKPMLLSGSSRAGANKLFRSNTGLPMMMRPSSSLSSLSMLGGTEANAAAAGGSSPKGTARRVLDLINQLNSPLEEIRKMASGSLLNESSSSASQQRLPSLVGQRSRFAAEKSGIRMNSPKTPYSRGSGGTEKQQRSPLTTELQVPSMPQLLQMNKLQRSTEEIRRLAFQSRSTLNQETEYRLPGGGAATESVSKMKVKLNRMAARGGQEKDHSGGGSEGTATAATSIDVPQFPEIKFPEMKAMPQIDIQLPPRGVEGVKEKPKSNSNNSSQVNNNFANTSKSSSMAFGAMEKGATPKSVPTSSATPSSPPAPSMVASRGDFQFAAPIALKTSTTEAAVDGSPAKMNFIFSAPSAASDGEKLSSSSPTTATPKPMFGAFKFNPETAKVKEGFTTTITSPVAAAAAAATETKKPVELKKGSVEEALGLAPKTTTSFGDKFKAPANTWSCSVCMVRNKETDLKCLACTTPKEMPTTTTKPFVPVESAAVKPADDGFKALIAAQKADKWECSECMTRNDSTAVKCLCCESPKPGSGSGAGAVKKPEPTKINSSNPFAPSVGAPTFSFGCKKADSNDEGFGKLLSAQQAKWECSTCMTRNEQKSSKCACCDQAKPGGPAEKLPQYSFGTVSNSNKFSFGVPQTTSKASTDEKTEAPTIATGLSFGASKPGEAKEAPKFAFGMPAAKVEESKAVEVTAAAVKKVEEEVKTPAVAAAAAPILGGFKFGVPSQVATTTTAADSKTAAVAEKITPIGGFKFGMTSATSSSPGGFAFGAPAAKTTTSTSSTTSFTTIEVKKSETATGESGKSVAEEEKKTSAATTTSTNFAFGSSPSTSVPIFGSATATEAPKKIDTISSPVFGGVAFGSKESPAAKEQSNNSSFGASSFTFGAKSLPNSAASGSPAPVFGSPAGGVVATPNSNSLSAIKPIAFGTTSAATAGLAKPVVGVSEAPKAQFAFGSMAANKEPAKPFGSSPSSSPFTIGASKEPQSNTTSSPFGAASSANFGSSTPAAATPSLFGGLASGAPAFGASAPVSTFGSGMASNSPFGAAKPAEATPSLFGSASSAAMSPFGTSSGAGGAQSAGIFGGITATQSSIPAFGSSAPGTLAANTTNSFDVKDSPTPFNVSAELKGMIAIYY